MAGFCVSGFKIQQVNPPAPPPPATPASAIQGPSASGNTNAGPPGPINVSWSGFAPLLVGDLLLAFILVFHDSQGADIINFASGIPAGWTMLRNDPNPGGGSLHGPFYYGIAYHVVGIGDAGMPTYTFSLSSAGGTTGHCQGIITMTGARGASAIEASALAAVGNAPAGKITAPSVSTIAGNELVFVSGGFGTGSGSVITSDNGLTAAIRPPQSQSNVVFYQFSTGGMSAAQPLTCSNVNDAMSAYQVSIAGI